MMLGEGRVVVGDDASEDKDEAGERGLEMGGGDVEDGSRGWGLL